MLFYYYYSCLISFTQADNDLTELKSLLESSSQSLIVSTSLKRIQNLKIICCHNFDKGPIVFMAAGLVWFERKEKVLNDKIRLLYENSPFS